jgi:integrase
MKHRSKRLLDRVRDAIRLKGYSVRTEQAYADWIKRFIIERLSDTYRLPAQLLYGSGLRLMECMRLRVGDLDFPDHQIVVRDSDRFRHIFRDRWKRWYDLRLELEPSPHF